MNVKARTLSGWANALRAARFTVGKQTDVGKEPSDEWKNSMCMAEHSPLREVVYQVECYSMPRRAMQHLVRHHEGIEKYVCTSRPDRNPNADPNVVDVMFTLNAQSVIQISRSRLCNTAWAETSIAWKKILGAISAIDPIVVSWCVPRCVHMGICPEQKCCGFVSRESYAVDRANYMSHFPSENQLRWHISLEK